MPKQVLFQEHCYAFIYLLPGSSSLTSDLDKPNFNVLQATLIAFLRYSSRLYFLRFHVGGKTIVLCVFF